MSGRVFFTSDTHFGHARLLDLCHRPFASVEEMDWTMVERWNGVVRPGDRVYHLGDFGLSKPARLRAIFDELAGEKHLIVGNHDHSPTRKLPWVSVRDLRQIKVAHGDQEIRLVLCHYPLMTWQGVGCGALHLHGHCHGNLRADDQPRLDVGVDVHDFWPLSLGDVLALLAERSYSPVDHHAADGAR